MLVKLLHGLIWMSALGAFCGWITAVAQPTSAPPLRIHESKAVTENEASFVIVVEREWKPAKQAGKKTPIDIQLRINNLGKGEVIFPTFDTFALTITAADGKESKPKGGRDGTALTRPISIAGGASYSLSRRGEIHWDSENKTAVFVYYDGTGSWAEYGLAPGDYKVSFWYGVTPAADQPAKTKSGPSVWSGKAVTKEISFDVIAP